MKENGRDPYYGILNMVREEADGMVPLYYCIGKILEITEETLRIQADGHELDQDDVLINDMLRVNFEEEADITMQSPYLEMSGMLNGFASPCANGAHNHFMVDNVSNTKIHDEKAKYKVKFRLRPGDIVLLIPDRERQIYYLVMKVVSHGSVPSD